MSSIKAVHVSHFTDVSKGTYSLQYIAVYYSGHKMILFQFPHLLDIPNAFCQMFEYNNLSKAHLSD